MGSWAEKLQAERRTSEARISFCSTSKNAAELKTSELDCFPNFMVPAKF